MSKKILITPLNWGLGHATRCIPIIRYLRSSGHQVVIGSDGAALALLQAEFPAIDTIVLPSYQVRYPSRHLMLNMMRMAPAMIHAIRSERKVVRKYVQEYNINGIISDNRFGCYVPDLPNAFITHQINLLAPNKLSSAISNYFNHHLIRAFDQVWVPDYKEEPQLTGLLSHDTALQGIVKYLGPLSRFTELNLPQGYRLAVVLSGPEPQRTFLENEILKAIQAVPGTHVLVRGLPETATQTLPSQASMTIYNYLTSQKLNEVMSSSEVIVARSGYSTVMDLFNLRKPAILIPTPGQPEQLFLAENLAAQKIFLTQSQGNIDIATGLSQLKDYHGVKPFHQRITSFETIIDQFLATL